MAGALVLFFVGPGNAAAWALAAGLALIYAGQSIGLLSQLALGATLSHDYNERARIYTWIQGGSALGLILALILPTVAIGRVGLTDDEVAPLMSLLVIVLSPVCMGMLFLKVRRLTPPQRLRASLRDYLALLRYSLVRRVVTIDLLGAIGMGFSGALFVLFFTRTLNWTRTECVTLMLVQFVFGLLATGLWPALARIGAKHVALAIALFGYSLCEPLRLLITPQTSWLAYPIFALLGIFYSGSQILPRAMMADVSDEVSLASGKDQLALLFAFLSGTYKGGLALSAGVAFWMVELIGFHAEVGASASHDPLERLRLLATLVPAMVVVPAIFMALTFPLTRQRHAQVREELQRREAQGGVGAT